MANSTTKSSQLRKLNPEIQAVILAAIASLADNPRPENYQKLTNKMNLYRIRVAHTDRVIYFSLTRGGARLKPFITREIYGKPCECGPIPGR